MIRLYLLGRKGLQCLKELNKHHLASISEIVVGRDPNVKNDYSEELFLLAKEFKISTYERGEAPENKNISLKIAIGWRWIITPTNNLYVFHDSLLPKYRGFNPLVTALIKGDTTIGATVLEGASDYDTGRIILQKKITISYPIKIETAIEKMANAYAGLLNEVLSGFAGKTLEGRAQEESLASYSLWREEEDYEIDWSQSAEQIKRFVDAVGHPYKGAKTSYKGQWLRVFDLTIEQDVTIANRAAGKVIFKKNSGYTIVCGSGLIRIKEFFDDVGNRIDLQDSFRIKFGK